MLLGVFSPRFFPLTLANLPALWLIDDLKSQEIFIAFKETYI